MLDHLTIHVSDREKSEHFYTRVMSALDIGPAHRGADFVEWDEMHDGRPPTEGLHLAFPAPDRQTVQEFHTAATTAGYRDNGAPALRPHYHPDYFSASVLDPDGNTAEPVLHERLAERAGS